ncbi:MAG: glycosyltransferase [Acidimicrobiia bacterium]|nr:glycosyltransferase [Acidimicrobiia bacterium]
MARVSILMTVYNGLPYLPTAVDSMLAQTYTDTELVIVDDGSTDGTPSYLASLDDPRIRLITQRNQGTAAAANAGLAACTGELLARMDADDVSVPHRLQRQVDLLDQRPEIGMVGSFTRILGDAGPDGVVALPTDHQEIVAALRAGRHALSHPTLMLRTELLRRLGGYWPFPLVDDWDMMLRMCEVTVVTNIAEPLLLYRVHRESLNGAGMARMRYSIDFARARAAARQAGRPEPTEEGFAAGRAALPPYRRLAFRATVGSLTHYRRAVAEKAGPHPWRAVPHLLLASALRPDLVVRRLARQRAAHR